MNSSSIVVSRYLAILYASLREGLYFPFSRKTIVSLLTPTIFARTSWVRLCLARSSLIFVFTLSPPEFLFNITFSHEIPPEDICGNAHENKKYTKRTFSSKLYQFEILYPKENCNEHKCQEPGIGNSICCKLLCPFVAVRELSIFEESEGCDNKYDRSHGYHKNWNRCINFKKAADNIPARIRTTPKASLYLYSFFMYPIFIPLIIHL